MNDEQRKVFCGAAAMGVACGLEHRYEWYRNAVRATTHGPYVDVSDNQQKLREAFLAFEKTTASCPEENDGLVTLTPEDYDEMVANWYTNQYELQVQAQAERA